MSLSVVVFQFPRFVQDKSIAFNKVLYSLYEQNQYCLTVLFISLLIDLHFTILNLVEVLNLLKQRVTELVTTETVIFAPNTF